MEAKTADVPAVCVIQRCSRLRPDGSEKPALQQRRGRASIICRQGADAPVGIRPGRV